MEIEDKIDEIVAAYLPNPSQKANRKELVSRLKKALVSVDVEEATTRADEASKKVADLEKELEAQEKVGGDATEKIQELEARNAELEAQLADIQKELADVTEAAKNPEPKPPAKKTSKTPASAGSK